MVNTVGSEMSGTFGRPITRKLIEYRAIIIRMLASKSMAHAERLSESSGAIPNVTYEDVDEALKIIISVTNWIATNVFYDNAFGTIVATTTFDPLEHLDSPWVTSKHLPNLRQHWREISKTMDGWADADPFVSRT